VPKVPLVYFLHLFKSGHQGASTIRTDHPVLQMIVIDNRFDDLETNDERLQVG